MARILLSAIAALVVGTIAAPAVAAGTVGAGLTVSAALTSQCRVATGSAGQTLAFAYTAFAADTVQTGGGITITFECTRGLAAPTVVFDSDGTSTTSAAAAAASVTGTGVAGGLRYEITATRQATGAGTAADANGIGTAATVPYLITGKIFGNQAGDATATATQGRTLTLAY